MTREKRVLLGELGRERERGEEEGRRVKEMEERLSHCSVANMELEKVPLSRPWQIMLKDQAIMLCSYASYY